MLVWSPDRSPLGGDAPSLSRARGRTPALSRGGRAAAGRRFGTAAARELWLAAAGALVPAPFLARVTRDERILDDRGGERKLRLTLADTTNAHDVVDAYVGGMDPGSCRRA